MIRLLDPDDFNAWLEIAAEVEDLFGPMVEIKEFRDAISECIINNNAYCAENSTGETAGIIAINREKNEIEWLAVRQKERGKGYSNLLMEKAISEMVSHGPIYVQTFSGEIEEGKSARSLYFKYGFKDLRPAGKNPAQKDTVIMVRY